ncbi:hypothetical protein INR49_006939 [Caranx melampygus]|nr:hypothetical protein INR49_006939 [Caranx melampygus]
MKDGEKQRISERFAVTGPSACRCRGDGGDGGVCAPAAERCKLRLQHLGVLHPQAVVVGFLITHHSLILEAVLLPR